MLSTLDVAVSHMQEYRYIILESLDTGTTARETIVELIVPLRVHMTSFIFVYLT